MRKTMSEKITNWKAIAYYFATHESDGDFNCYYDDIINSGNIFQTNYSSGFVKKIVERFGYEYVTEKVTDDAKKAGKIINDNEKLNDIIERAEAKDAEE